MTAAGSLRGLLREQTAPDHERVDALASRFDLQDRAGYAAFLLAHARALLPLEAGLALADVEALLPDWPSRRREAALRADLEQLGAPDPPPVAQWPSLDAGRAWGVLYVLEGSRLGARLLLRGVLDCADPEVRAASRFLSHGEGGRLWPSFLERLELCAAAPSAILDGARTAFDLYARALNNTPPALNCYSDEQSLYSKDE